MSNFCLQCGSAISADTVFCTKCGARISQSVSSYSATPRISTAKSKLSMGKILLVAVGLMVLFGTLCLAELIYAGYRMTVKASDTGKSGPAVAANRAQSPVESQNKDREPQQKDVCSLVTKEEIAQATGTSVATAAPNEDKDLCTYTPSDGGISTVTVQVNWQDGKLAMKAFPAMTRDAVGHDIRQPVPDIGDEAYILGIDDKTQQSFDQIPDQYKTLASFATGPLMFRKGDIWVTVTATLAKNKADAEKKIASLVSKRL